MSSDRAGKHPGRRIERILVALDVSEHGRAALEAAAELAARLGAELIALHIEDADLLRLASLPFAREIDMRAAARPLQAAAMERALRATAQRARQTFERTTANWQVRATFRVVRGPVTRELVSAGEDVDLVFVGRAGGARSRRARLGRTARMVLGSDSRAVAVLADPNGLGRPVATIFDGSGGAQHALELAIALAGEDHRNLLVAIPAPRDEHAPSVESLAAIAARIAEPAGIRPRCVALTARAMQQLPQWLREQGCRGLVVDRHCALFSGRTVPEAVEAFDCPVVVVR